METSLQKLGPPKNQIFFLGKSVGLSLTTFFRKIFGSTHKNRLFAFLHFGPVFRHYGLKFENSAFGVLRKPFVLGEGSQTTHFWRKILLKFSKMRAFAAQMWSYRGPPGRDRGPTIGGRQTKIRVHFFVAHLYHPIA